MHPILDALSHTQDEWLRNLLFTFNEGNIQKFDVLSPLFPKEVSRTRCPCRNLLSHHRNWQSQLTVVSLADFASELSLFTSKNLPHGFD